VIRSVLELKNIKLERVFLLNLASLLEGTIGRAKDSLSECEVSVCKRVCRVCEFFDVCRACHEYLMSSINIIKPMLSTGLNRSAVN